MPDRWAIQGASAVRPDWIETVENANQPFFEEVTGDPQANFLSLANRMVSALESEKQNKQDRLAMLDVILG